MAETKKRMFEGYNTNSNVLAGFNVTESGLLIPKDVTPKDMKDSIKEMASQSPEARAEFEKKIDRKLGTIISLYQSVFNTATNSWSGAADKPRQSVPHSLLRSTFRNSIVDQLIILARMEQVKLVSNRVYAPKQEKGWLIKHKRHADPYFRPSKSDLERMEEVAQTVENPWSEVHPSFRDLLVRYVQDRLIIDRICMPITRSYTGKPLKFYLLPGDDIKPRYEVLLRYMREHNLFDQALAMGQIYSQQGVNLADMAWVQEIDSFQVAGAWRKDELAVSISNPSNEINNFGYGKSCLERSVEATTMLLLTFNFNRQIFEKNYPDQLLVLKGEVDPIGLEYMKQQLWGTTGPQSNHRLPVIPTNDPTFDMQVLKLRETLNEMQFTQLIRIAIALKAAAYRAHPSLINMSPDQGDTGKIITTGQDQADIIGSMQEEGFKGLLRDIEDFINRNIIWPWYPDLIFTFSVEEVPPEQDRVALATQKFSLGLTSDEWRASEGLPTLEEATEGSYSGKVPGSPFILQDKEMRMQEMQMQEQAQMEEQRSNPANFTGGGDAKRKSKPKAKPKKKDDKKKSPKKIKKSWFDLWSVDNA